MKRVRSLAIVLLALTSATAGAATDESIVLTALTKACDAFREGDVAYLATFLSKDFTLTSSTGEVTNYEQNLAEVRAREPRYEVFKNHHMKVRFYGDTALVNGTTTVKGTASGVPFAADFQFTDALIRRNGRWVLVASHASRPAK